MVQKCFHPKRLNLRYISGMTRFSDIWELVSVRKCCGQRYGWFPLSPWMDMMFVWKYCDTCFAVFSASRHCLQLKLSQETFIAFLFITLYWQKTNSTAIPLKAGYTFGNCQRPVSSLGVSQQIHQITNLWKFGLNWSSKLQEKKNHPNSLLLTIVYFQIQILGSNLHLS